MIKQGTFKATDLLKVDCPSFDVTLTHLLAHVVRCAGNREKLDMVREALREIDQFIAATATDSAIN